MNQAPDAPQTFGIDNVVLLEPLPKPSSERQPRRSRDMVPEAGLLRYVGVDAILRESGSRGAVQHQRTIRHSFRERRFVVTMMLQGYLVELHPRSLRQERSEIGLCSELDYPVAS